MKKLFFLLLIVAAIPVSGQTFDIKKGEEFEPEDNAVFQYYIGIDDSGIFLRRTRTKGRGTSYFFQKLNRNTLKVEYTKDFETEKTEEPFSCQLKGGKIIFLSTKREEKDRILLMREYKSSNGEAIGSVKQISQNVSDPTELSGRDFEVSFSPDNTKLMVVSEVARPKKLPDITADVYEFPSYKKLGTKKLLNVYEQSTIASYSYKIDNEGRIFYMFNYMKDFDEQIQGKAIVTVQANDQKNTVTPIPFDKLEVQNGVFEFINDKLVLAGAFKDVVTKKEKKEGKLANAGVFSFFIDPKTSEVLNKGYDYFTPAVSEKLNYKDGLIQANPGDKFYSFEQIFTFNNNVYLIESHSYVISGDKGYFNTERELIVSKFNSTGKLEWMRIIPKYTCNDLNSFNFVVNNNKVYLFYAEHPDNVEEGTSVTEWNPKKYKQIKNFNGSVLVCTTFDESGTIKRTSLFRNEGWCYDPIPTNISLEPNNSLIFRMINRGKERYDVLKIN
jgi:hypothetical protein